MDLLTNSNAPSSPQVMPLRAMLAPVAAFKENIAAALDGLLPDVRHCHDQGTAGGNGNGMATTPAGKAGVSGGMAAPPCRALGPALLALLDYLQALRSPPFTGTTVGGGDRVGGGGGGGGGGGAGAQTMADLLPPPASPVHLMLLLSGVKGGGSGFNGGRSWRKIK